MLWLKAFHVIFMVTWFAGLFYLPRLYLYHASTEDEPGNQRFKIMERKLFAIMTIGGTLTAVFGVSMLVIAPGYLQLGWLHAKLTLVIALLAYHFWCYRLLVDFRNDANRHSAGWYRLFNEVPTALLLGIIILVIVKPF